MGPERRRDSEAPSGVYHLLATDPFGHLHSNGVDRPRHGIFQHNGAIVAAAVVPRLPFANFQPITSHSNQFWIGAIGIGFFGSGVTGLMGGYPGQFQFGQTPSADPLQTALGLGTGLAGIFGALK